MGLQCSWMQISHASGLGSWGLSGCLSGHWHCRHRTVWHVRLRVTEVLASFAAVRPGARPWQQHWDEGCLPLGVLFLALSVSTGPTGAWLCRFLLVLRAFRGLFGALRCFFGGPSLSAGVREAPEGKLLRGSESYESAVQNHSGTGAQERLPGKSNETLGASGGLVCFFGQDKPASSRKPVPYMGAGSLSFLSAHPQTKFSKC